MAILEEDPKKKPLLNRKERDKRAWAHKIHTELQEENAKEMAAQKHMAGREGEKEGLNEDWVSKVGQMRNDVRGARTMAMKKAGDIFRSKAKGKGKSKGRSRKK